MHNIDRTTYELNDESPFGETAYESELPGGTFDRPFSEAELDELTYELLQVRDEQELEQFIAPFIAKAAGVLGKFMASPAGGALKKILKEAVTSALPNLIQRRTQQMTTDGVGTNVGTAIRSEVDWEGAPADARDVETAKKVIEVGAKAAQQVATMPPNAPVQAVADAVQNSANQMGIPTEQGSGSGDRGSGGAVGTSAPTSGRWFRRGRTIVITGL